MPGAIIAPVVGSLLSDDNGAEGANNAAAAASQQQAAIAKDQWDSYKKIYQPKEEQFVNESFAYDTPENRLKKQNEALGLAATTTSQQFNRARQQLQRSLDPSNRGYANAMAGIGLQEAAARAGNMTMAARNAAERAENLGRAYKTDAISLGKGLPGQVGTLLANSAATNAGLADAGMRAGAAQAGAIGRMVDRGLSSPTTQNWMRNTFGGGDTSHQFSGSVRGVPDFDEFGR